MTKILSESEVRRLITIEEAIAAVESAFGAHGRSETMMPSKVYLGLDQYNGDFRAMPVFMPKTGASGTPGAAIKWINSHPDNPHKHGLPSVIGVMILSDPVTAEPLAIMDATWLTRLRTGAAAAVGTRYLAGPNARTLGIVGCGAQAHVVLGCQLAVRDFDEALLFDVNDENARALADAFPALRCRIVPVDGGRGRRRGLYDHALARPRHRPSPSRARYAYQCDGRRCAGQAGTRRKNPTRRTRVSR